MLTEQVRSAGLLRRRPWYYSVRMALVGAALLAGWAGVVLIGDSWAVLGIAVFLAVASVQTVFVGHDAGHQQIFRTRSANRVVGLAAGNTLTGLSFGWWVPKHNAHHAHPNQVDRDPDIGAGVIAFTPEIAAGRRGTAAWLSRWQAWLFFPLLTLEGVALRIASVQMLARRRDRAAAGEAALLLAHTLLYLGLVFWVLSPLRAVVFIVVQQSLFGLYLGCSFAPNHKGMPIIDHDSPDSFLRRQVITSRNVTGGRWVAWLLGGLNYQIEHHLFPSMPRPHLAQAQSFVKAFCAAHDLPYEQSGLVASYRQALTHLRTVGLAASTAALPPT